MSVGFAAGPTIYIYIYIYIYILYVYYDKYSNEPPYAL